MGNDTKVLLTDKKIKEDLLKKASRKGIVCAIAFTLFLIVSYPMFFLDLDFGRRAYMLPLCKIAIPVLVIYMIYFTIRNVLRRKNIKKGSFLVTEEILDSVESVLIGTNRFPIKSSKTVPVLIFRRCRYVMVESNDFHNDMIKLKKDVGSEVYLVFASAADNNPLLVYSKKEYERTN